MQGSLSEVDADAMEPYETTASFILVEVLEGPMKGSMGWVCEDVVTHSPAVL